MTTSGFEDNNVHLFKLSDVVDENKDKMMSTKMRMNMIRRTKIARKRTNMRI